MVGFRRRHVDAVVVEGEEEWPPEEEDTSHLDVVETCRVVQVVSRDV